jgi:hypothetical protein
MRVWLLLLVFLLGCRYTFVPLQPDRAKFPERLSVFGRLEALPRSTGFGTVRVRLQVRQIPEPNYLELRWYKEDQLFQERSVWVERPGDYLANVSRIDEGYYRLVVLYKKIPLLQLELGTPLVPEAPNPDEDT